LDNQAAMVNNSPRRGLPQRVLIVWYSPQPPLAASLAHAFARLGVATRVFYSWKCNTLFDRFIIHFINHQAHNLRLVPKSVDLFAGHPKSHKEWRSQQLLNLAKEFEPDLIMIIGIHRFKEEVLHALRQTGAMFLWFSESEKRFPEIAGELPVYHHIYVISSDTLERVQQAGFANASLLQHAVDPSLFRPLEVPQTLDWCFVGQWHKRRQQYVEGLAEVSKNFVLYGTRWRKHNYLKPAIFRRIRGTGIWGEEVVRLYNRTRVVINISVWGDEARGGKGANMRILEVPACRACLLTDHSGDAEQLLQAGEEFVSAATLEEMQEKLAGLLAHPQERHRIAQAGYERASRLRNYDDLVQQILADWAARPGS
jgi:glycosyltransferase involved in cell wall biosynthesis